MYASPITPCGEAFVLRLGSGNWEAGCGLSSFLIRPFMWVPLLRGSASRGSRGTAAETGPCSWEKKALGRGSLFSRAQSWLGCGPQLVGFQKGKSVAELGPEEGPTPGQMGHEVRAGCNQNPG